ncbi:MAG: hypothetical protein KKD44_02540 [Proteobacteria bacterium]|nr:hypothetical protein [Pseudomonadota bacterium]
MDPDYILIRDHARRLVKASPLPDFYKSQAEVNHLSRDFYQNNPIIRMLKKQISTLMDDNLGHGLHHAEKVSQDAGALILIVCRRQSFSGDKTDRMLLMSQCAGLLHDIKRKQKNHALASAEYASTLLTDYSFSQKEITDICQAIRNHEAFKENCGVFSETGQILSNCLYDADKFRWGPDNFTHTVWDMVANARIPLSVFMSHFPRGLETVGRVRTTFRSEPGQQYGPQFIDIGMDIGNKLYLMIKSEFPSAFDCTI